MFVQFCVVFGEIWKKIGASVLVTPIYVLLSKSVSFLLLNLTKNRNLKTKHVALQRQSFFIQPLAASVLQLVLILFLSLSEVFKCFGAYQDNF